MLFCSFEILFLCAFAFVLNFRFLRTARPDALCTVWSSGPAPCGGCTKGLGAHEKKQQLEEAPPGPGHSVHLDKSLRPRPQVPCHMVGPRALSPPTASLPACCLRITPCPVGHTSWLHTRRRGLCSAAISAWGRDQPPLLWHPERGTVDRRCVSRQKAGRWCPPAQLPLVGNQGVKEESLSYACNDNLPR